MKDFKETLSSPGKLAAIALVGGLAGLATVFLYEKYVAPKIGDKLQKNVSATNPD